MNPHGNVHDLRCRYRPKWLAAAALLTGAAASQPAAAWVPTATQAYQPKDAILIDRVKPSEPVRITVALRLQNRPDLDKLISHAGLPSRRSPSATALDRFLPTADQAANVVKYLQRTGFHNVHASSNRLLVTAEGNAAAVQKAFNTALVHASRNGRTGFTNTDAAQVPTELGNTVLSVIGLQTIDHMIPQVKFGGGASPDCPVPEKAGPECSPIPTPPGSPPPAAYGLNPVVFQTAYNAASLPTASLTQIGIIAEGNLAPAIADLHTFESGHSLPTLNPTIVLSGQASSDVSNQIEWDLDSQTAQSVAQTLGGITFYVATTLSDPDLTSDYNAVISGGSVKIINVSLGECELTAQSDGAAAADDQIFALALANGQTFSISSGDRGSSQCENGSNNVSYPSSSPYVVAVGGTTLTLSGSNYGNETAWSGSGGGPSQFEAEPQWQQHVIPGTTRGVPDLAFDADPNSGVLIINNGSPTGPWGGTSLASPIFVGLFARLQSASGNTLPFPAQWIYHFPTGKRGTAFHDITTGSNGGYQATTGWDYVTGFGSLNAAYVRPGISLLPLASIINYLLNP